MTEQLGNAYHNDTPMKKMNKKKIHEITTALLVKEVAKIKKCKSVYTTMYILTSK